MSVDMWKVAQVPKGTKSVNNGQQFFAVRIPWWCISCSPTSSCGSSRGSSRCNSYNSNNNSNSDEGSEEFFVDDDDSIGFDVSHGVHILSELLAFWLKEYVWV